MLAWLNNNVAAIWLFSLLVDCATSGYPHPRQTLRVLVIHGGKEELFIFHHDHINSTDWSQKRSHTKRAVNSEDDDQGQDLRLNGSPGQLVDCVREEDILPSENEGQVALMVKLGHRAELPCHKCGETKPSMLAAKVWFRFDRQKDTESGGIFWRPAELHVDSHDDERLNRVFVTTNHTLVINDFQPDDVGTYFCEAYSSKAETYTERFAFKSTDTGTGTAAMALAWKQLIGEKRTNYLFHVDVEIPQKEMLVTADGNGYPKPQADFSDAVRNVKISTVWGPWSECTACGQKAERRRSGECMVQLLDPDKVASPPHVNHVLQIYHSGAPCQSSLVSARELGAISERTPEIEIEGCLFPCKEEEGERTLAKSFAGRNIVVDTMKPSLPVSSMTIKRMVGEEIKLFCPGAKDDTAVRWQNGSRLLITKELPKTSGGRVEIDVLNMLVIHKAVLADSETYTCYHDHRKQGSFTIKVETIPVEKPDIRRYLIYMAASYVLDLVLFIGFMCTQHKQRMVQVERKPSRTSSSESSSLTTKKSSKHTRSSDSTKKLLNDDSDTDTE